MCQIDPDFIIILLIDDVETTWDTAALGQVNCQLTDNWAHCLCRNGTTQGRVTVMESPLWKNNVTDITSDLVGMVSLRRLAKKSSAPFYIYWAVLYNIHVYI